MFKVLRNGLLRYILYTCPKSIVMNLTTCTHGAHKIHSGKTAKDLYLTTCTHGAHKIHSCKNKGVHTAKPFRVYRRGPWPRVQMRPLTACTDEAVTLATLARTIRVYLRPQKARAQPTPWPSKCIDVKVIRMNIWHVPGHSHPSGGKLLWIVRTRCQRDWKHTFCGTNNCKKNLALDNIKLLV